MHHARSPAHRDYAAPGALRTPLTPLQHVRSEHAPGETATLHVGCAAESLEQSVEPFSSPRVTSSSAIARDHFLEGCSLFASTYVRLPPPPPASVHLTEHSSR